ncbi:MAG: hypothetical protein ACRYG4_04200 [Janthinobacterium lividum]
MNSLLEPKFIIAYTVIVGFFVAYAFDPTETMKGALIAAFAGAWGFFLGSSSGAAIVRDQVGKALDIAAKAQPDATVTTTTAVTTAPAKGPSE